MILPSISPQGKRHLRSPGTEPQMTDKDEKAQAVLLDIERSEKDITDVYMRYLEGDVGNQHFYLFGIARRALAQSAAFRQMIDARNSLVALSLLRLQLDTVLRLYALFWVKDPQTFATRVFNGEAVNKMKAADGNQLTDKYLCGRLAARNPWVPDVYKETSGFIHFSKRHIMAAFNGIENNIARIAIGPKDADKTLSYYDEPLRAFLHINMMIPVAAEDWFQRLKGE